MIFVHRYLTCTNCSEVVWNKRWKLHWYFSVYIYTFNIGLAIPFSTKFVFDATFPLTRASWHTHTHTQVYISMSLKPRKRYSITSHPLTPVHKFVIGMLHNTCSVSTVGTKRPVWAVWQCANSISMFSVTELPRMSRNFPVRIKCKIRTSLGQHVSRKYVFLITQ